MELEPRQRDGDPIAQPFVRGEQAVEVGPALHHDVDILGQSELRADAVERDGAGCDRPQPVERRVDPHLHGGRAQRHGGDRGGDQDARSMPPDPAGKRRHRDRRPRAPHRARQQRRNEHQREDAADHHGMADERAQLLQAGEVDERQPVEGRRRRPHAEQHTARGTGQMVDACRGASVLERQRMHDVEQHHPVDAEPEQHRGGCGRRRRQRGADQAEQAEHREQRQRGRQGADAEQPCAAEHDEQQRQDQRERHHAVHDAFAPDDRFGLDRDAMAAGELDLERRQRVFVGWRGRSRRGDVLPRALEHREQRVRCGGVIGRPRWMRDDQPAP